MTVAELEAVGEPEPLRWSSERHLALVESGVIAEGRGIELIDGQVMTSVPQGKLHYLICLALQRVFESMGAAAKGFLRNRRWWSATATSTTLSSSC